jgi:hypothetical protein
MAGKAWARVHPVDGPLIGRVTLPGSKSVTNRALLLVRVCGLDKGLDVTPPMGLRSWDSFGADINQTVMEQVFTAMVSRGRAVGHGRERRVVEHDGRLAQVLEPRVDAAADARVRRAPRAIDGVDGRADEP